MKLKNNFALTKLADDYVAVSLDNPEDFHGIIKLNESGAEVFRLLSDGNEEGQIVQKMMEKYQLDEPTAKKAVTIVIERLNEAGLLE